MKQRAARAFLQAVFGVLFAVTAFALCGALPELPVWQTALFAVTAGAAAAGSAFAFRQ